MTADPTRLIWGAAAVALWLVFTAGVYLSAYLSRRRERAQARAQAEAAGEDAVLVAFASQTGFGEELALMTAQALNAGGVGARVVSFADLDIDLLKQARRALFVVATTGEGDAPDSATRALRQVLGTEGDLPHLSYGMLALGDREYRDFCGFGHAVDGWLRRGGATALFDMVEVDDADPAAIRHWQHQLNQITGSTAAPDWTPPAYDAWRLVERRLLNPGSPGGEAYHLAFEPMDHAADWQAGDIVEIGVPARDGAEAPAAREYSIASLPADGRLDLLVRLMTRPDGTPGLASGWLTGTAVVGDAVSMRVRTNRSFHGPDPATPMILIGNGTGLAGLRAHLQARQGANAGTWLLFGERTSAHDAFHAAELQAALVDGSLTRLDRCFSRDAGDGRYVQQLITEQGAEIAAWIERGAVVYVCGSLEGMASGVQAALEGVLGAEQVVDLVETGRYRRDVY